MIKKEIGDIENKNKIEKQVNIQVQHMSGNFLLHDKKKESTDGNEQPINLDHYLRKIKEKYTTIKTLLYSEEPKAFYDFYVCNDIERTVLVRKKFENLSDTITLEDVTVKDLLVQSHYIILSGTGGLGKSMMLRHLLLNSIDSFSDLALIPVFIPLKDFDKNIEDLDEFIYSKINIFFGGSNKNQFLRELQKGKCLLLFDGLDEIASNLGEKFIKMMEGFTDKYPENYYVISSRPSQNFISYSRFTVWNLKPFDLNKALSLINKLEFRVDEPLIKEKFRKALSGVLYRTHGSFIQNPLLLTIMLLTFEQYAEVPSKMHVFYREAFAALSVKHDANKGAYKRTLKSSLSIESFGEYFSEFCARSYHDEKFDMSEVEFVNYFRLLKSREREGDRTTSAIDFLHDLCSNMCLMYSESGKLHFTHRSFQEYFCALYFSKQKDKNLKSIGSFFNNKENRIGDKTFNMLYDMIPEKVEEYILLPFLSELFEKCDRLDGYWTFLEEVYPKLSYERGEVVDYVENDPIWYLYSFIKKQGYDISISDLELPHYDSLVEAECVYVEENNEEVLVYSDQVSLIYALEYGKPEVVGRVYEFNIKDIRKDSIVYEELITSLNQNEFILKIEYNQIRGYFEDLKDKQWCSGDSLFDLF